MNPFSYDPMDVVEWINKVAEIIKDDRPSEY